MIVQGKKLSTLINQGVELVLKSEIDELLGYELEAHQVQLADAYYIVSHINALYHFSEIAVEKPKANKVNKKVTADESVEQIAQP